MSEDEFSDLGKEIWKRIVQYYDTDVEADAVDVELLMKVIEHDLPKHAHLLNNTIKTLAGTSPPNLIKEIIRFKKEASAHKLATALVTNHDGNDVDSLIDDFREVALSET
ncbi:MAG: hypothetical protein KAS32_27720, partial [Candidatus Peribacteraceae bacterium]|nr:hypothetical protein [Candidatus Peribacteraceae bacterium]